MKSRSYWCKSEEELNELCNRYFMAGYEISYLTDGNIFAYKKRKGSCGMHIILFLFVPLFIGNIIYAIHNSRNEDEIILMRPQ